MASTCIFVSYRRDDAAGHAGRIYDRLRAHFGEAQVFLDVNSIPGATDFTEEISAALGRANVLVVVVGTRWLDVPAGRWLPRLHDPKDLVRAEIAAALSRSISVVPVLVGGARMPGPSELPTELEPLAFINAVVVSDHAFDADVTTLLNAIARSQHVNVAVTVSTEIYAGQWEICKQNFGLAPLTIHVQLNRDGSITGRMLGMGGIAGGVLGGMGNAGGIGAIVAPVLGALGNLSYGGRWHYDVHSKCLTLELLGQAPMLGGGAEVWQMTITGHDRGVFIAMDREAVQYTIKRVG